MMTVVVDTLDVVVVDTLDVVVVVLATVVTVASVVAPAVGVGPSVVGNDRMVPEDAVGGVVLLATVGPVEDITDEAPVLPAVTPVVSGDGTSGVPTVLPPVTPVVDGLDTVMGVAGAALEPAELVTLGWA